MNHPRSVRLARLEVVQQRRSSRPLLVLCRIPLPPEYEDGISWEMVRGWVQEGLATDRGAWFEYRGPSILQ